MYRSNTLACIGYPPTPTVHTTILEIACTRVTSCNRQILIQVLVVPVMMPVQLAACFAVHVADDGMNEPLATCNEPAYEPLGGLYRVSTQRVEKVTVTETTRRVLST